MELDAVGVSIDFQNLFPPNSLRRRLLIVVWLNFRIQNRGTIPCRPKLGMLFALPLLV